MYDFLNESFVEFLFRMCDPLVAFVSPKWHLYSPGGIYIPLGAFVFPCPWWHLYSSAPGGICIPWWQLYLIFKINPTGIFIFVCIMRALWKYYILLTLFFIRILKISNNSRLKFQCSKRLHLKWQPHMNIVGGLQFIDWFRYCWFDYFDHLNVVRHW